MKDSADEAPLKLNHGYPMPRVVLAVGIAVAVHGALLSATVFSASGKAPEAPTAKAKTDSKLKPADGNSPAAQPKEITPPAPDKLSPDGPGADAKPPVDSEPKKVHKPVEPTDELKLDSK